MFNASSEWRDGTEKHITSQLSLATSIHEAVVADVQLKVRNTIADGVLAKTQEGSTDIEYRFLFYIYYTVFMHLAAAADAQIALKDLNQANTKTFLLAQRLFMEGTSRTIFAWDLLGQVLRLSGGAPTQKEFDPDKRRMVVNKGVEKIRSELGSSASVQFQGQPWLLNEQNGFVDWLRNRQVHDSFHYVLPACDRTEGIAGYKCRWYVVTPKVSLKDLESLRKHGQVLHENRKKHAGKLLSTEWAEVLSVDPSAKRLFFPNDSAVVSAEPMEAWCIIETLLRFTLIEVIPTFLNAAP